MTKPILTEEEVRKWCEDLWETRDEPNYFRQLESLIVKRVRERVFVWVQQTKTSYTPQGQLAVPVVDLINFLKEGEDE